jgi:hypothetical protein
MLEAKPKSPSAALGRALRLVPGRNLGFGSCAASPLLSREAARFDTSILQCSTKLWTLFCFALIVYRLGFDCPQRIAWKLSEG